MAAWRRYGPATPWSRAPLTSSIPSPISPRSQRLRSCSAIGTSSPCVAAPRGAPRIGEEHQREQPGDLGIVGQEAVHHPAEPDRLGGKVGALQARPGGAHVALVEDEVEDAEDDREPLGALGRRWQAEREAALPDGLLGPGDPAGHGVLGHEERPGDLCRRQPAEGAQGEGDLRGLGQGRMAAHEEQDERVVRVLDAVIGRGRRSIDVRVRVATTSSRRRRACSWRSMSVSLRDATVTSQAERVGGQCRRRASASRPRGAPPAPRPRRRRNGRSAERARRGPAARAGAAGPRSAHPPRECA